MVKYNELDVNAPVALAFRQHGLPWAEGVIAVAGVAGITSVLLVLLLSGPRVFLAMARDGLVPNALFGDIHRRFRTPWKSTMVIGAFVLVLAAFGPVAFLLHLTNIGTLLAFVIVCAAVIVMRYTHPDAERPFRCPFVPVVPALGVLSCLMLMFSLPVDNWWRLLGWLCVGFVIYFAYGRRHSVMRRLNEGRGARGEGRGTGAAGARGNGGESGVHGSAPDDRGSRRPWGVWGGEPPRAAAEAVPPPEEH
jgi:APA family basic amino acid/polyamine antiporter